MLASGSSRSSFSKGSVGADCDIPVYPSEDYAGTDTIKFIPFGQNRAATRASSLIKRFQERVSSRLDSSHEPPAIARDETPPVRKRPRKEAAFFKQLAADFQRQNRNLLIFARSFLPVALVQSLESGFWATLSHGAPSLRHFRGTIVQINFTGIHLQAARLLARANGDMHLAKTLDSFFVLLADVICSYRGDVVLFTGSSMSVFFEAVDDHERFKHVCGSLCCSHTPEELSCLRAASFCLELSKRFRGFDAGVGEACPVAAFACGVATGPITLLGLKCGFTHTLSDYIHAVAGSPMRRAAEAAKVAAQLGEPAATVLTPESWNLVMDTVIEGAPLEGETDFRYLEGLDVTKHTYPMVRHAAQQSFTPQLQAVREFDADAINRRLMMSLHFLQHSVMVHALAGNSCNVSESRNVSLVFFFIGGINPTTEEGARDMGPLVKGLVQAAYSEEGSLLKLIATDCSLLFHFAFGLPPLVHLDDPQRACKACFSMAQLAARFQLVCSVSVVTDRLFCGIVGSGKHRAYSVMGAAVQRCESISAVAEPSHILVDRVTFERCSSDMDFKELEPISCGPGLESLEVFQLLHPRSGYGNANTAEGLALAKEQLSNSRSGAVSTCVPPWLAQTVPHPSGSKNPANLHERCFPTLWTCIWCERLAPNSPKQPEIGMPSEGTQASYSSQPTGETHCDELSQTHVAIPIPWPARSIACGGVSPVPSFSSWRVLIEAERHLAHLHANGGGLLCLAGPSGCGKTELAEHLICNAVREKTMLPVFGAMEMRMGQERHAVYGVVRGILPLLEPSAQNDSDETQDRLLSSVGDGPRDQLAVQMAGLAALAQVGTSLGSPCSEAPSGTSPSSPSRSRPRSPPARLSINSTTSACTETTGVDAIAQRNVKDDDALVGIAVRLVRKVLERTPLVIGLRVSQGTSRTQTDLQTFWSLVQALEAVRANRTAGANNLVVVVICQEQHIGQHIEFGDRLINVLPLVPHEAKSYIYLCLRIIEPKDGRQSSASNESSHGKVELAPESPPVAPQLIKWLIRLANVPRYIEEALTELRRTGVFEIENGRCTLRKSLDSVNFAEWMHTRMVANVVSEAEALTPEKQQVLQIATTLEGPISTLDLAAANRFGTAQGTGGPLVMQRSVRRLAACKELVKMGLLRPASEHEAFKTKVATNQSASEPSTSGPGEYGHPAEAYDSHGAPSWVIPSVLIHRVIKTWLFQSHRMELKRAILVNRAIVKALQSHSDVYPRTISNLSVIAKVSRKQRRWRDQNLRALQLSLEKDQDTDGFPTSCLVTPFEPCTSEGLLSYDIETDELGDRRSSLQTTSLTMRSPSGEPEVEDFDFWAHASLVDILPIRCLRRIRQLLMSYCLATVAFGTDLALIFDGSEKLLDGFLVAAIVLVSADVVAIMCLYSGHFRTLFVFCDFIVFLLLLLEITWAYGTDPDAFSLWKRRREAIFRVPVYVIKVGACTCRLSAEIQMIANWIQNNAGKLFARRLAKADANAVTRIVPDEDDEESNDFDRHTWQSKQLADIGHKVTSAVLVTLTVFTVLAVLSIKLTDYSLYPDEDASMATWLLLIGNHLANGTTAAKNITTIGKSSALSAEINNFQKFYDGMGYGPYSICRGRARAHTESFACSETIWRTIGDTFSEPERPGFRLNVESSMLQASFDFTGPAKLEAIFRCALFVFLVLCTIAIAVAVDSIVNKLVIWPLSQVFSIVRMIAMKLHHVPHLNLSAQRSTEDDEVSMLENAVERLVLLVTASKPVRTESKAQEWLNPNDARRNSDTVERVNSRVEWPYSRIAKAVTEDDQEALKSMGIAFDDVDSWSFNVFSLMKPKLDGVTGWLLWTSAEDELRLDKSIVTNFVGLISNAYHEDIPYHNWKHAADVHHTLQRQCRMLAVHQFLSPVDTFALLVAAIGHDVGHPGFNNVFLQLTSHDLTLRYNDKSPLENMHCATMFSLMLSKPEADIFQSLSPKQYKEARQMCIQVILHTDNAKHFEMLKEMQMLYASNCETLDREEAFPSADELDMFRQTETRGLAMNALMHGADISNACKPWAICSQWADLVIAEFFRQGDEEKRLGIPVQQLNDRDKLNRPSSQVAFIEFFVAPFYKEHTRLFAPIWPLAETLQVNLKNWHEKKLAEVEMDDDKREAAGKQVAKLRAELKQYAQKGRAKSKQHMSKKDAILIATQRPSLAKLRLASINPDTHSPPRSQSPASPPRSRRPSLANALEALRNVSPRKRNSKVVPDEELAGFRQSGSSSRRNSKFSLDSGRASSKQNASGSSFLGSPRKRNSKLSPERAPQVSKDSSASSAIQRDSRSPSRSARRQVSGEEEPVSEPDRARVVVTPPQDSEPHLPIEDAHNQSVELSVPGQPNAVSPRPEGRMPSRSTLC